MSMAESFLLICIVYFADGTSLKVDYGRDFKTPDDIWGQILAHEFVTKHWFGDERTMCFGGPVK